MKINNSMNEAEWEAACDKLTTRLDRINPSGEWLATVENFGWQNRSALKQFYAPNGQSFLLQLLPAADWRIELTTKGKTVEVRCWHHDSPTGNERYTIKKAEL